MSLIPPLYCATCAAPCLLPRKDIPPPSTDPLAPLVNTDTVDIAQSTDPTDTTTHTSVTSTWESRWFVLQVSKGLCTSYTILPPHTTSLPNECSSSTSPISSTSRQRCISIHAACLEIVLKTIRKSLFNSGFSHEENMMVGWSLPKWSGYGPWVKEVKSDGSVWQRDGKGRNPVQYWTGCEDQRNRWEMGKEGSHLLPVCLTVYFVWLTIDLY